MIVSILTRPGGRVQPRTLRRRGGIRPCFNPHPSRRTGATSKNLPSFCLPRRFNPHPSRRTGATAPYRLGYLILVVSILTRPGGRVQQPQRRR